MSLNNPLQGANDPLGGGAGNVPVGGGAGNIPLGGGAAAANNNAGDPLG